MDSFMLKKNFLNPYLPLGLLFVIGLMIPLLHTILFKYPFESPKFALYDMGTSLISLYYFYHKKELHLSILSLLASFLLVFMFISIMQSVNIAYSFEFLFRFFNTSITIALIFEFLHNKKVTLQQIGNSILFASILFLVYYFYGKYNLHIFQFQNTSFSSIGHINYTAHLLEIWIPLLWLNFVIQSNKLIKYLSLTVILLLTDVLLSTGARGAIFGLIFIEILLIFFLFFKHKKIKLYPFISLSVVGLFFLHKLFLPSTIHHTINKIEQTEKLQTLSTKKTKQSFQAKLNTISSNRVNVYLNTWDMIRNNPWGVGANNYEYIHPLYAKVGTSLATGDVSERKVFTNPHNIILKFTSELGWIGGLLFIVLLTLLSKMVFSIVSKGEKIDYMLTIAFGATLFHSMLSAVFLTPANLFFVTVLFGMILYRYYSFVTYKSIFKIQKIYFKSYLLLIPLFFSFFYLSKYYNHQFTTQRNFSYLGKAIMFNPYNDQAIIKQAQFAAYANRDYSLAIHYLKKYLKLYPYNIDGHIKKATFEYQARRYNEALKTIKHLLSFDPKNKKMLNLKRRILEQKKR